MRRYRVADIFGSQPRNGGHYWWDRDRYIEGDFSGLFKETTSKKVVVIDGPSGAGKTSLAYRTLYRSRTAYNYVSVDDEMNWKEFCRRVVSIPKCKTANDVRKFGFSIRNFLPGGKADAEHSEAYDSLKDLEYAESYLEHITLDVIVDMLIADGVALIIDDFEKANPSFLKRIANLSKKISNPMHSHPGSKLIIISCHRSFEKMIEVDDTLEGRIHHITLGGLRDSSESWGFLLKGFEKLKITHPGSSKLSQEKDLLNDCMQAVYDATGGILRSLTELGEKLANDGYETQSLKANHIINIARKAAQENIDKHVRRMDAFVTLVSENEHVSVILSYLYRMGVNRYHVFANLQDDIQRSHPECSPESGISLLIDQGFLVPTGVNGSRVFAKRPNYALAFCTAWYRKEHYRVPPCMRKDCNQRHLALLQNW